MAKTMQPFMDADAVRAALRHHVSAAMALLRREDVSDDHIHRARKNLKSARASLRLLRGVLDDATYARENAALREAARPLARVRDAKVMVDTLDALLAHARDDERRALLGRFRDTLESARRAARKRAAEDDATARAVGALEEARKRIARLRVADTPPTLVQQGVQRIYRNARDALKDARDEPTVENLHEWRKHVKYLGQALQTCGAAGAPAIARLVERTHAVAERLGQDHDLVVLQKEVARRRLRATNGVAGLDTEIEQRRIALQAQALKEGERLLKAKPSEFVAKVIAVRRAPKPHSPR